ncbi:hypothetical protein PHJA_000085700, partial [Phtheirospermum japonicum]
APTAWERIAARLRTGLAAEVEQHYAVLLADVRAIEAGMIESQEYNDKNVRRSPKNSEKKQTSVPLFLPSVSFFRWFLSSLSPYFFFFLFYFTFILLLLFYFIFIIILFITYMG